MTLFDDKTNLDRLRDSYRKDGLLTSVAVSSSSDFLLNVIKGNILGHSIKFMNAHGQMTATEGTIQPNGLNYQFLSTAQQLTVSSTSVNDTLLGTGLRTMRLTGLDANYNEVTEIINLSGQTPVTTTNSYLRLSNGSMFGLTAGALGYNEGQVYIGSGTVTGGVPAVTYSQIEPKENLSHIGVYTVPAGYTSIVTSMIITTEGGKTLEMFVKARELGGLFRNDSNFDLYQQAIQLDSNYVYKLTEKTDLKLNAIMSGQNGKVKVVLIMLEIDNNYL